MQWSRRLPVSARKTDVLRMVHHSFITCCNPITKIRSISMSTLVDASSDLKAGLDVVLVSLFARMPHGA